MNSRLTNKIKIGKSKHNKLIKRTKKYKTTKTTKPTKTTKSTKPTKPTKTKYFKLCPLGIDKLLSNIVSKKVDKDVDLYLSSIIHKYGNKINNLARLYQGVYNNLKIKKLEVVEIENYLKLSYPSKVDILYLILDTLQNNYHKLQLTEIISSIPEKEKQAKEINKYIENNSKYFDNLFYGLSIEQEKLVALKFPTFNFSENKLQYTNYVSHEVHQCIINELKYKITYSYSYKFNDKEVKNNIIIYTPNKSAKFDTLARYTASRILFMNHYLNTIKSPKFTIYYCSAYKYMPDGIDIFAPNNLNTAVTDGESIIIWRSEELLKSIIHECIHFYNLDFHFYKYPNNLQREYYSFGIDPSSDLRLSEAYTELWANVLNLIITLSSQNNKKRNKKILTNIQQHKSSKPKKSNINENSSNNSIDLKKFARLLKQEILFSQFQASKILNYLGCQTIQDFYNKKCKLLKQTTNAFSYHFVKSKLLMSMDKILQNCVKTRNDELLSLQFVDTQPTFEYLHNLIMKPSNWEDMMDIMLNSIINIISKSDKSKTGKLQKNDIHFKTLRMTSVEQLI